ncbi:MAG: Fe-S cluster assembly protein SufD [Sinobacteraceae bacterium]|nr:Fe-S cluster assembly protein SufD [Nevskiaceae bacterium]
MSAALLQKIAADFAAVPQAARQPRRREAMDEIAARGLPGGRDENWKYVNLRSLDKLRFAPPQQPAHVLQPEQLPAAIEGYARYAFIDGVLCPALSAPLTRSGVLISSLAEDRESAHSDRAHSGSLPADLRFALLNDAFATDGARIQVRPGTECPACIELLFIATAEGKSAASYPRIELEVAAGAEFGLIERHVSARSETSFVNCAVQARVARDARVRHFRIQQSGTRATFLDTLTATLAENASYQVYGVGLGAQLARSTLHVQLQGRNAEIGMFNVSVGGRTQTHDSYALVEHVSPGARSGQTFRGIASGRARVSFNGKVVVRSTAQGTDSQQSLRGLLAGQDAEIDVRPQLEIYTDDVRCSHGATAGKLDENMLFYLLSRGLDRDSAQRILKWAFLEDVVAKIEVPELRRQIEHSLVGQLDEASALQELL